ncbi:hypothetical protein CVT25_015204 [Psilocybe cyanescens]|uniref:Uncharacterized protein n=1 Tax=Psilocybe cyanescens TaxID=93625 RepID=A0A409WRM6_PSICY|nr:hypothetical protein CVT25_015204 [Psilocybe cyanescens]
MTTMIEVALCTVTPIEIAIFPYDYDKTRGGFSGPGGFGAIVLARNGYIVGMLTSAYAGPADEVTTSRTSRLPPTGESSSRSRPKYPVCVLHDEVVY